MAITDAGIVITWRVINDSSRELLIPTLVTLVSHQDVGPEVRPVLSRPQWRSRTTVLRLSRQGRGNGDTAELQAPASEPRRLNSHLHGMYCVQVEVQRASGK
ncbi:hypothetical protein ABLE94_02720 [Gordonia sp. VNK1]|uniref:hypothetical protein n=1 Tax=Gordonia oleivorans TaxID=3156618 RepID=UPI0032B36F33